MNTPLNNFGIKHRAAGNLAFLLSVIHCGESLSTAEEAYARTIIDELRTEDICWHCGVMVEDGPRPHCISCRISIKTESLLPEEIVDLITATEYALASGKGLSLIRPLIAALRTVAHQLVEVQAEKKSLVRYIQRAGQRSLANGTEEISELVSQIEDIENRLTIIKERRERK